MSYVDVKIPHALPQGEALRRIQDMLANLQEQYAGTLHHMVEQWDGHQGKISFTTKGFSIAVIIYVGVDTVRMSSRLPFLLSFYKSKIVSTVEKKGAALLVA